HRPRLEGALLEQIGKAHREKPVDLFFSYFYSMNVTPETISRIRKMGIMTVNWYCNASYQFDLVRDIAPAYDYCLVPEKFRLADYERVGATPIYCQEAANPNIYRPYDLPVEFDVTFVGQKYGERPAYIRYLLDQGIDVRVWGPFWQGGGPRVPRWRLVGSRIKRFFLGVAPLFPVRVPSEICGPPLSDEELIRMYSRSKINLGFSTVADTATKIKQVRLRDFEVPMSGGFYMVDYMSELEEFFNIGEEIVCYHSKEDLAEKAKYYLAHDAERERIRRSGMERARRDHTWQERFQTCFAQMGLL
ncbi:MAG: CgeB family protein, partial [Anaerolineae bacterium]